MKTIDITQLKKQKRIKQNSFVSYKNENQKAGSIKGRIPVHIPELKMTVYTVKGKDPDEIREKYLNNEGLNKKI